jgi:hypothetical protein
MSETQLAVVTNENETVAESSETFFSKKVGISEAATITGRSRGQIGRDSNTGRLTYTLDDKEQKRYVVSDLYQLYGFKRHPENLKEDEKRHEQSSTETVVKIAVLESELAAKTNALNRIEEEVRDLRQSRDKLLEQNNRLTLLLPSPQSAITQPPLAEAPPPVKKPFWQRLFS